ncbi:hypothetical protein D3C86_2055870 [compost metagenome]
MKAQIGQCRDLRLQPGHDGKPITLPDRDQPDGDRDLAMDRGREEGNEGIAPVDAMGTGQSTHRHRVGARVG